MISASWVARITGVRLCLIFWGTAKLFSIVAGSFHITTSNVQSFHFFISWLTLLLCFSFFFGGGVLRVELGLALARQVLYHLSHTTSPLFF
jgi:hypothetical protein